MQMAGRPFLLQLAGRIHILLAAAASLSSWNDGLLYFLSFLPSRPAGGGKEEKEENAITALLLSRLGGFLSRQDRSERASERAGAIRVGALWQLV